MSPLSSAWRDRFRRKPVRERSSRSLLVRSRPRSTDSMRSCFRATWLSTEAHCRTRGQIKYRSNLDWCILNALIGELVNTPLTLLSPAVMFCSAPAAASRVVELISHCCSTWLYTPTICGCHSHSTPFGTRETSVKVERSWFFLCQGKDDTRRQCWDGCSGPCAQNADGLISRVRTFLAFLLWGVKQPMASPFPESWALVGPSRRIKADGGISP